MESIHVPNLKGIRQSSNENIDRPATLCEVLKSRCAPDNINGTIRAVKDVIAKTLRHPVLEKVSPTVDLSSLVKDLAVAILTSADDTKSCQWRPKFLNFLGKRRLQTVETFDNDSCKDLTNRLNSLRCVIKQHQKVNVKLQKAQEKCWMSESKVSKYQLLLTTAKSSREHLRDRLSKRELRSRDDAIAGLEKTLKARQATADDDAIKYCELVCQEERCRQRMTILSRDITNDISFAMMDRLEEALITINAVAETCLSKESHKVFLDRLFTLDVRETANSIIKHSSNVYMCPEPTEYARIHGPHSKLPTPNFTSSC